MKIRTWSTAGASRSNRKDRYNSFERSQKMDDSTFSDFCCEEPSWRLAIPRCSRTPIRIRYRECGPWRD